MTAARVFPKLSKGARLLMQIRQEQKAQAESNSPPCLATPRTHFNDRHTPTNALANDSGARADKVTAKPVRTHQGASALRQVQSLKQNGKARSSTTCAVSASQRKTVCREAAPRSTTASRQHANGLRRRGVDSRSRTITKPAATKEPRSIPKSVHHLGVGNKRFKAATLVKYNKAIHNYLQHRSESTLNVQDADANILQYINQSFEDDSRPGQRQEMANLISMLNLTHPQLQKHLPLSRRALKGWKAANPSKSSVPLTRTMMFAFAN